LAQSLKECKCQVSDCKLPITKKTIFSLSLTSEQELRVKTNDSNKDQNPEDSKFNNPIADQS